MNWKDILERAMWTAAQAAVAVVPPVQIAAVLLGGDITALQQLGLSAVSAFVGALLSAFKTIAQERIAALDTRVNTQ